MRARMKTHGLGVNGQRVVKAGRTLPKMLLRRIGFNADTSASLVARIRCAVVIALASQVRESVTGA